MLGAPRAASPLVMGQDKGVSTMCNVPASGRARGLFSRAGKSRTKYRFECWPLELCTEGGEGFSIALRKLGKYISSVG